MNDLISRKALLEEAEYDENYRLIVPIEKIKRISIAYDVDKVVKQLEKNKVNCNNSNTMFDTGNYIKLEKAIEIVKSCCNTEEQLEDPWL